MTMPGRWQQHVRRWMCHRVDIVYPEGNDVYGQPVDGTRLPQVPCYIDGSKARLVTEGSIDHMADYTVEFPREVSVDVNVRLENGRDRDGNVLLPSGRILKLDGVDHPEFGTLVQTVYVGRN